MENKQINQKIKAYVQRSQLNGWNYNQSQTMFNSKSLLSLLQNQIKFPLIRQKQNKKQNLKTQAVQKVKNNYQLKHLKTMSEQVNLQDYKNYKNHLNQNQNQSKQILKRTLYSKQYFQSEIDQTEFKPFRRISDSTFLKHNRKRQIQEEINNKNRNNSNIHNAIQTSIKKQLKNTNQKNRNFKIHSLDKFSKTKSLTPIIQFMQPQIGSQLSSSFKPKQTIHNIYNQAKDNHAVGISSNSNKLLSKQKKSLIVSNTIFNKLNCTISSAGAGKTNLHFDLCKNQKQSFSQKNLNNRKLINKLLINSKQVKDKDQKNMKRLNLKLKSNRILTQPFPQFNDTIIYQNVFDVNSNINMKTTYINKMCADKKKNQN